MEYLFESERLGLRNWRKSDLTAMASINNNPEVMRYFPSCQDTERTAQFIDRMQEQFKNLNYCYFAAEIKESKEFIGFIGMSFQEFPASFTPCTDIGWRLKEPSWNKGYATEGAKACLEYAWNELNLSEIYSIASLGNLPSINVMKKIGMSHMEDFIHPKLVDSPELQECAVYKISKN